MSDTKTKSTAARLTEGAVEKRKVIMTNAVAVGDQIHTHVATDYVPLSVLDAYVADAATRWQSVVVDHDAGHDPGPGGDDGATDFEAHLKNGS